MTGPGPRTGCTRTAARTFSKDYDYYYYYYYCYCERRRGTIYSLSLQTGGAGKPQPAAIYNMLPPRRYYLFISCHDDLRARESAAHARTHKVLLLQKHHHNNNAANERNVNRRTRWRSSSQAWHSTPLHHVRASPCAPQRRRRWTRSFISGSPPPEREREGGSPTIRGVSRPRSSRRCAPRSAGSTRSGSPPRVRHGGRRIPGGRRALREPPARWKTNSTPCAACIASFMLSGMRLMTY